MFKYLLILTLLVSLFSCSSDDYKDFNEKCESCFDIQTATVNDLKKIKDYDYVTDIWKNTIKTKSGSNNITSYGYTSKQNSSYHKIQYGDVMAEELGLVPHTLYLECEVTVYFRVLCNENQTFVERNYASLADPMGWIPGMIVDNKRIKGFKVGSYAMGYRDFSTQLFYIGYDALGREVGKWYPFEPDNLVWYYTVVEGGGWD